MSLYGDGEFKPTPPVEPQVDKTFMDPSAVDAWRADIAAAVEADAAALHPLDLWRYTACLSDTKCPTGIEKIDVPRP